MNKLEQEVMLSLENTMCENGYRAKFTEDSHLLRVLYDDMGSDEDGEVLFELGFLPLEDFRNSHNALLFQIFSTIAVDLKEESLPEIYDAINEINLGCLLGGYHVFRSEMQLYHRYVQIVNLGSKEEILSAIQPSINWISNTIDQTYDTLMKICKN